jgi:hypothetical protein
VVTASRLLIAVSASSIAAVDETITIPRFRLLVVLRESGNVPELADHLGMTQATKQRRKGNRQNSGKNATRKANPIGRSAGSSE